MNKKFSKLLADIKVIIDARPRKPTHDRIICFCCDFEQGEGEEQEQIKELMKNYSPEFSDEKHGGGGFEFLSKGAAKLFCDEKLYVYYCTKQSRWVLARKQQVEQLVKVTLEVEVEIPHLI